MKPIVKSKSCSLYTLDAQGVYSLIASTPETRKIVNDPTILGVEYTNLLETACQQILPGLQENDLIHLKEDETIVLNILRGGLNFGLRNALAKAFNWNSHGSAFISAQRARKSSNSEEWYITESDYQKVYVPKKVSLVFGDVVATGTSLHYALEDILQVIKEQDSELHEIIFFTIGGNAANKILSEIDATCRKMFPTYKQSLLVFLEGCFVTAEKNTPVSIKINGTDLLRGNATTAPEFIESQYANPAFPLERCTIYDAGSRAFWIPEYLEDVREYWEQTLKLAENGMTFSELLQERFPELNAKKFKNPDLIEICKQQLNMLSKIQK